MLVNFNDIGFAHSTILSYNVSEDNVNLKLEWWDGKIFEMNFIKMLQIFQNQKQSTILKIFRLFKSMLWAIKQQLLIAIR